MKKIWMILLAMLLATGLVLVGCGGSGGGNGGDETPTEFYVVLEDNFQYGEGYQGQIGKAALDTDVNYKIPAAKLFGGNAIKTGDTYELAITFTASRDLEDALWAGLVDTVTGYWNPLSWDGSDDDDDGTLIQNQTNGVASTDLIKAGETITGVFKFTALKDAPSSAIAENVLNFQTEGEPSPGTTPGDENPANSGVKGPVTLTFTEFVFSKTNGTTWEHDFLEAEAKQPPKDPPTESFAIASPVFYAIGGSSAEMTVTGSNVNITHTATSAASSHGFAWNFPALGNGFAVTDYDKINVKFTIVSTDGGGVSYNAKDGTNMQTNVNVYGKTGDYDNELAVIGTTGDSANADYPVAGFVNDLVAFQFNPWAGSDGLTLGGAVDITITVELTLVP